MADTPDDLSISVEECKEWLVELYREASKVREKDFKRYRKVALMASLLEEAIEKATEDEVDDTPVSVPQSLPRGLN